MVIWLLFAVLTATIVFVVLGPLAGRGATTDTGFHAANIAVYKDQLSEIDADLERGVIAPAEAAAARVEVSRKILQIAEQHAASQSGAHSVDEAVGGVDADQAPDSVGGRAPPKILALVLAGLIPISAGVVYAVIGAPHLPDLPHAPRLKENLNTATAGNLLARVEARLRSHPEDGKGWDIIAPFYYQARRYGDAADAYRNATRLLGETPRRMIGYVKSAISANNGVVTEDLRQISERLIKLAPERAEPKFWLGLAQEQDGNFSGAKKAYSDLLATAKDEDPWREMVQRRLEGLKVKAAQ